ncbi:hypothetical protein ACLMJK_004525 [Lecanora helva]
MPSAPVRSVDDYTKAIRKLLAKARKIKAEGGVEPVLTTQDFGSDFDEIKTLSRPPLNRNYAAIETACRSIFYESLASTSIEEAAFGQVWNLFDALSILSDLEELLDTQTIQGCKVVFDYLDSRRERITAKHFKQKNLIILRACNELLRRLSRAEDTVFCGRVFIFLFQSFPLGDRSSVNLRGEYHTENITVFEDLPPKAKSVADDRMEIDQDQNGEAVGAQLLTTDTAATVSQRADQSEDPRTHPTPPPKTVKFDAKDGSAKNHLQEWTLDMDELYPIFWSLQESFSTPTRLFEETNLQLLKEGLEATMRKFKEVHQELSARGTAKVLDESKRGVKRKRNGQQDELSTSFNPKYLTSRDLFDLEISDLAFRRHVLVQALILVDFLLSLTPKAKKKLENTSNKSVLYTYTLSEENTKWALNMRSEIATYLQQGPEGKFYYRMVDTVLSRDKNWVHWKAEGCPPIQRDPVSAEDYEEAGRGVAKACADRRLRSAPFGSLDLAFLSDGVNVNGMDRLKDPDRYLIPTAESFQRPIANDEFELEMAKTDEERRLAVDAKASKLWRTLRIAAKTKLNRFDKIDDGNNLQALFGSDGDESKKNGINGLDENSSQPIKAVSPVVEEKPPDSNGTVEVQQELAVN